MYLIIGQGNKSLGKGNIGGFANEFYWSSTNIHNESWGQNFGEGYQLGLHKNAKGNVSYYVRAVRAF